LVGDITLRDKYPRNFANLIQKGIKLEEGVGKQWKWNMLWRIKCFELEKPMIEEVLQQIKGCTLLRHKDDEWVWKGEETQEYTVKYAYKMLQNSTRGEDKVFLENSRKQKHYLQPNFLLGDFFKIS